MVPTHPPGNTQTPERPLCSPLSWRPNISITHVRVAMLCVHSTVQTAQEWGLKLGGQGRACKRRAPGVRTARPTLLPGPCGTQGSQGQSSLPSSLCISLPNGQAPRAGIPLFLQPLSSLSAASPHLIPPVPSSPSSLLRGASQVHTGPSPLTPRHHPMAPSPTTPSPSAQTSLLARTPPTPVSSHPRLPNMTCLWPRLQQAGHASQGCHCHTV